MAPKKENLPINAQSESQGGGTITYANEVIAIIAGIAANEVDGIAGMCASGGIGEIIGRNRNITRGVKVEVGTEEVSVDLYSIIEYGQPIQKVACEAQENVRKSIESMTGLKVVRVDVHVQGVSFEKEKREAQTNLAAASLQSLPEAQPAPGPGPAPQAAALMDETDPPVERPEPQAEAPAVEPAQETPAEAGAEEAEAAGDAPARETAEAGDDQARDSEEDGAPQAPAPEAARPPKRRQPAGRPGKSK